MGTASKKSGISATKRTGGIFQNCPKFPAIATSMSVGSEGVLRKHGLQSLATLIEAFDGSTGNVFYDYDPESWLPITISEKDLIACHEDWLKVQKIRDTLDEAYEILETDPTVFPVFLEAYLKSLHPRERKVNK